VAKHYEIFGGVSPINQQNRNLIAALQQELAAHGPRLPIYWGNRNWHPLLADTLAQMAADGIRNALAFVTSAYSSYSSCRQYLDNIAEARAQVGSNAPKIAKLRTFYNHPLFIEANVDRLEKALSTIPEERRASTQMAFTAHSIPQSMAGNCQYESQLQEASRLVSSGANHESWRLVYQSRSGPPAQPWLGPDIIDHLKELKDSGATDVVIAPIGFVSDHMEVIYDLDTEARQFCDQAGLNMVRAATVGTHPLFIRMIRELVLERINPETPRRFLGTQEARPDLCFTGCCLPKA
jgi:ferrochelatase